MNDVILKANNIHKYYPSGKEKLHVLRGLDLEIKRAQILVIIGPSGAGKSTLLHILGGLDCPSKGRVLIDGVDLYKIPDNKRAKLRNEKIGFVFQFYHLLPEFTALENVILPFLIKNARKMRKREVYNRAYELLDEVGLINRAHHKPDQLSGGEQQRVAVARALMNEPELLLCDEPTGNLDSKSSERLIDLLRSFNEKNHQTLMIVSHNESMNKVADRVIKIKDGRFLNQNGVN